MKYTFFFLVLGLCFFLSSCFEKQREEETTATGEMIQQVPTFSSGSETSASGAEMFLGKETQSGSIIISPEQENSGVSSDTPSQAPQNVSQEETVEEQQEIIENAEEDLEALFRDLIPSE